MEGEEKSGIRLDKWLWAARFFKTRTVAQQMINGGHVSVAGARVKPSRNVVIGDRLSIRRGDDVFHVEVRELSDKRLPASRAQALYLETDEGLQQRLAAEVARKLARIRQSEPDRRPNKRERRRLLLWKEQPSQED